MAQKYFYELQTEYLYEYRSDLFKRVTICTPYVHTFHPRKDESNGRDACNMVRARSNVQALALCNPWTWFVTLTLSSQFRDRKDLDGFRSAFTQFVRDSGKKYHVKIDYLLVPELHKNKDGWHMHGLINGLPVEALRAFSLSEKLPAYLRKKLKAGEVIYDWPAYRRSFGWVDVELVKNRDAAARYITKYITKGLESTADALDLGKHLYYCSKGLKRPKRIETANAPGRNPEAFPDLLVCSYAREFEFAGMHCLVEWLSPPACDSVP